ncbi:hypothetical protein BDV93DRAFT_561796 [Ceratobasidium sp. AG-I]|nr:hypothetical protein BDV93DRAFT_561796 [Ceratobasidium sp. AG-I]
MVFSWLLNKDFVGQYYGPGLDLLQLSVEESNHYREQAYAILEVISTDSLTIMRGNHLSSPLLSLTAFTSISYTDGTLESVPESNLLTYLNGSQMDWTVEANIYLDSIYNLIGVATHTVELDLGAAGPGNIYLNSAGLNNTVYPNLPPPNTQAKNWARKGASFYYGPVDPPYNTWAEMILAGQKIKPGNMTGLPKNSSMDTTYLCPTYKLKQTSSLLTSIFVGTSTMVLSVWGLWMFVTGLIARRIEEPCLKCTCSDCKPKSLPNSQNGTDPNDNTWSGANGHASRVNEKAADLEAHPSHLSYRYSALKHFPGSRAQTALDAFPAFEAIVSQ